MSRRTDRLRFAHLAACVAAAVLSAAAVAAPAASAGQEAMVRIGRAATPAEVKAWDIDVRGDWKGLPAGAGSVNQGADVWDAKCASCHGAFGESNQVFTPIVGGTTKEDIESGRVAFLTKPGYPHRTTLMRASRLSPLWDYINRAMPWNEPKSLKTDEVYAVLAYILNLGNIVPGDFTLSNRNIAEVEKRLPNRNGKRFYEPMWIVNGKGDVKNPACMTGCAVEGGVQSTLPDAARDANGNIAEQVRLFGATRGVDTTQPPRTDKVGVGVTISTTSKLPEQARASGPAALQANGCTACHALSAKLLGPAFHDVASKYAGRPDAVAYLAGKIRSGGQGVWGPIPMPAQPALSEDDAKAIAGWLAAGAR